MLLLELFAGTKSVGKIAKQRGWDVVSVDSDPLYKPTIVADLAKLAPTELPNHPDMIWASPPCTYFSKLNCGHHWAFGMPFTPEAQHAIQLVKHTLHLIHELGPTVFYVENPVALLRRQHFMSKIPRFTVTYCQYGFSYRKPTDIWTNDPLWEPRPMCNQNDFCHGQLCEEQERWLRAIVPPQLCREILESAEAVISDNQTKVQGGVPT